MSNAAAVQTKLDEYLALEKHLSAVEEKMEKTLEELKTVANSPTFNLSGQYFQVRKRNGHLYLCRLDGPPKGRPRLDRTQQPSQEPPPPAPQPQ